MKKFFLYPLLGTLGIVLVVAYTRANVQTNQLFTETVPPSELLQTQTNCSTYPGQVGLLTAIADNYAQIGQKDKSLEILAQTLPLVQCIPDKCNQSEPMAKIASQYAVIREEVRASEILNQAIQVAQTAQGCMSHNSSMENLLDISQRYLDAGQYKLAIQAVRGLKYPESEYGMVVAESFGLAKIAEQLAEAGQVEQAVALFEEAMEIVRSIDSQTPGYKFLAFRGFYHIASFAIQAGFNEQAIEALVKAQQLVQTMDEIGLKTNSLVEIAQLYAKLGQSDQAVEFLSLALSTAKSIEKGADTDQDPSSGDISFKVSMLGNIAVEYATLNQAKGNEIFAFALQVAQAMEDEGSKARNLSNLARDYARAGQYEQALEVAQMINPQLHHHSYALRNIAEQYIEDEKFEEALKVAKTISNPSKRETREKLSYLATRLLKARQPKQALKLLQVMEQISKADPEYNPDEMKWIRTRVAKTFAADGEVEQALMVAQTIDFQPNKARVLLEIAEQYALNQQQEKAAEMIAQALMITQSIDSKFSRASLLIEIAEYYAVNRQQENASKILAQAFETSQAIEPEQRFE
ncbi:MAG: hypothetical protein F6K31_25805 [Symploca sp. SIO2G7]|nr:hypothetical protein [Symploca sp. SIO2G7]